MEKTDSSPGTVWRKASKASGVALNFSSNSIPMVAASFHFTTIIHRLRHECKNLSPQTFFDKIFRPDMVRFYHTLGKVVFTYDDLPSVLCAAGKKQVAAAGAES